MTQTFTTRLSAIVLAAAIMAAAWLPTVTVPPAGHSAVFAAAVA